MSVVIDDLTLKINGASSTNVSGIEKLKESLKGLNDALNKLSSKPLEGFSASFSQIRTSIDSIRPGSVVKIERLANAMDKLSKATNKTSLGSVASAITNATSTTRVATEVQHRPAELSTASGSAEGEILSISDAMRKVEGSTSSATKTIADATKQIKDMGKASDQATKSANGLTRAFGRILLYRTIRTVIKLATDALYEGFEKAYEMSQEVGGELSRNMDTLVTKFNRVKTQVGVALGELLNAFAPLIIEVLELLQQLAEMITWVVDVIRPIIELVRPFLEFVASALREIVSLINSVVAALGGSYQIVEEVPTQWKEATKEAKKYRDQLLAIDEINNLKSGDEDSKSPLSSAFDVKNVEGGLPGIIPLIDKVQKHIEESAYRIEKVIHDVLARIYNFFKPDGGGAPAIIKQQWDNVINFYTNVISVQLATEYPQSLEKGIVQPIENLEVLEAFKEHYEEVRNYFKNVFDVELPAEYPEALERTIVEPIKNLEVLEAFQTHWFEVRDFFKDVFDIELPQEYPEALNNAIVKPIEDLPILEVLQNQFNAVKEWLDSTVMPELSESKWNNTFDNIPNAMQSAVAKVPSIFENLLAIVTDTVDKIVAQFSRITGAQASASSYVGSMSKRLPEAYDYNPLESVTEAVEEIVDANAGKRPHEYLKPIDKPIVGYAPDRAVGNYGASGSTYTGAYNNISGTVSTPSFYSNQDAAWSVGVPRFDTQVIQMPGGVGSSTPIEATQILDIFDFWDLKDVAWDGGYIPNGHLFLANEDGNPEYIGSMNGHTAVANQGEMTEAIKNAAYEGFRMAMSEGGGIFSGWEQMSSEDMYLMLKKSESGWNRRSGAFA